MANKPDSRLLRKKYWVNGTLTAAAGDYLRSSEETRLRRLTAVNRRAADHTSHDAFLRIRIGEIFAASRLRTSKPPNRNAHLTRLVGEVLEDARSREDDDTDRERFEQCVIALEGRCILVTGPIRFEGDL